MDTPAEFSATHRAWSLLFEDRYGVGSARRLMARLERPCVTFARIAEEFGVTRECVRQWHQRLLPDAPSGHRRQQLCREHQMKRRLLQDGLFLGFYRRMRSSVPGQRVTLIPSRNGFRKRTVRIGGHTVSLRRARQHMRRRARTGVPSTRWRAVRLAWISSTTSWLLVNTCSYRGRCCQRARRSSLTLVPRRTGASRTLWPRSIREDLRLALRTDRLRRRHLRAPELLQFLHALDLG